MTNLIYILVGIAATLAFADAALTLDGLRRGGGRIIEKNRLMTWFVKSPWRLYPLTVAAAVATYFVAHVLTVQFSWIFGAAFCLPMIIQRAIVVVHNYRLNVKVL